MATAHYVEADRPIAIATPLGKDDLLLIGLTGHEALSQLFSFQLDLLAENAKDIAFDKLLGQKATVRLALANGKWRYFSGICNRISQGMRDNTFTGYRMEIVPQFWLLTRIAQSRIFQQMTVPDILKQVLQGLDVVYEIQGTFFPRDYCVQYRETDFNFASRLMEEEGIYYFFTHSANGHTMVVGNTPKGYPTTPGQSVARFEARHTGAEAEDQVLEWHKTQELRSGRYTLWDHSFELPHKHLEADKTIVDGVAAGKVTHKLKVGGNDRLEIYDYPGEYAQRFDGVNPAGGDRPADPQHIFEDNKRTVAIRMQEEAARSLVVEGTSNCRFLVSGHTFALHDHFNADGNYLLTGVQHSARLDFNYRSGGPDEFAYHNSFTCIPADLPYRPARSTPKPFVQGTQTAVVVGPSGEEIFTDKYGRVKVQFHWDRQGHNDGNSSCWVRVATAWAGKQWGAIHIPRIGQEVVVDFQEGDPDQPIIIGSVYNADMMPPYTLPANKTQSGVKSRSTLGGTPANFNELRFEDKKGSEEVYFHAEKDFNRVVENNDTLKVGSAQAPDGSQTIEVYKNRTETVKTGNETIGIDQGNRAVTIGMGNDSLMIKMGNQTTKLDLGKSETEALQSIELKVGQSSIKVDQMGVTIKGMMVSMEGQIQAQVKGMMTQINGDAMLMMKGGITMIN